MSEQYLADRTPVASEPKSQVVVETLTPEGTRRGLIGRGLLAMIGGYRRLSGASQPRCRYLPTCSEYAQTAIERHGTGRGSWLATRRLCRCHPFGSHGFDPVPPVRDSRAGKPPNDEMLLPPEVHT